MARPSEPLTPEFRLLIACCRAARDHHCEVEIRRILEAGTDWTVHAAAEVLNALGYRAQPTLPGRGGGGLFFSKSAGVAVDLRAQEGTQFGFGDCFNLRRITFEGRSLPALRPEELLVLLVTHGET